MKILNYFKIQFSNKRKKGNTHAALPHFGILYRPTCHWNSTTQCRSKGISDALAKFVLHVRHDV
jgi:hypothetical protein